MNQDVVAIIPARSGSKSVRDKNIALLAGFPVLAYSIAAARMSSMVGRIILSTDSERYAEIGRRFGAEVPFLRPTEISTDRSTDRQFMEHAMTWVRDHEGSVPELWMHLRPTTPLRDPTHLDEAVDLIRSCPAATALRSAHECSESPFKWFRLNADGYLTALTSDDTSLDRFNLPRQAYPTVYIPDGYVDLVRASFVFGTTLFHGDKVLGYESPFCIEVDSQQELDRLEFQVRKDGSPLLDYLRKNFEEE